MNAASMLRDVQKMRREVYALSHAADAAPHKDYAGRFVDFCRDKLGVTMTPRQEQIALAAEEAPYRVLVKSANGVGKTMFCACFAVYWFLTRSPAIVITTAPKLEQVRDLLWKEMRRRARKLLSFPGPKICRVDRAADDFMTGTTAQSEEAFKGHHGSNMLFIFDEAVGVDPMFWEATETMFSPPGHAWICIFNPTDSSSAAYQAEHARGADGQPTWNVITMSALDHPNILEELAGNPPPYPDAVRLGRVNDRLAEGCDPVVGVPDADAIEWPPGSGNFVRPGPVVEASVLGRWPSQTSGVWSDSLWKSATETVLPFPKDATLPCVGCDVARFGDDDTVIHARWGGVSLLHEWHNGWSTAQTAGRLKEVCREMVALWRQHRPPQATPPKPEDVPVFVDDDGVGGGVTDQAGNFNFIGSSGANTANDPELFPNRRSEAWFATAAKARQRQLDLTRLPRQALDRLRLQLMAPTYKLDAAGRRVVEPKDKTKEKIKRSPDDADALNLAQTEFVGGMFVYNDRKPERRL